MQYYTEDELEEIRAYEKRTGEKVTWSYEEKLEIYRTNKTWILEKARTGLERIVTLRLDLFNAFDGPEETWRNKNLSENLSAINRVLYERQK